MSINIMDDKKTEQKVEGFSVRSATNFVGEVKSEFKKISWTDREELNVYTKVVVGTTFFLGIAVYLSDLIIQSCLSGLNIALRFITG